MSENDCPRKHRLSLLKQLNQQAKQMRAQQSVAKAQQNLVKAIKPQLAK